MMVGVQQAVPVHYPQQTLQYGVPYNGKKIVQRENNPNTLARIDTN